MAKFLKLFIPIFLVSLFLFLRFYHLSDSFFFYNDMGRDMIVLEQWQDTGKPPLLGPQTSALPFNQSAVYFYLLYPGFLISHGNPISSLYTLAVVYITAFIFGLYLLQNSKPLTKALYVSFFLISIHPQYISQFRYVWNPSFVTPFLITAIISFYLLLKKYSRSLMVIFSISIALAVSFSYSVAPLLFIFFIFWLAFNRRHYLHYLVFLFISFLAINASTLLFEIRHHFLLTTSLLTKKSPTQNFLSFGEKINSLSLYVFATPYQTLNIILLISFFILCIYLIFKNFKHQNSFQFTISFLLFLLIITTLLTPVTVQAHYIFALTSLLFILVSTFNKFFIYFFLLFFSFIYLQPLQLAQYFIPAPRTYSQMKSCFQQYCSGFTDPTFVSVQSDFHPFHNGPEHRYLLKLAGCSIRDIETQNGQAQSMTVVVDNSTFNQNTKFYELELFGKYETVSTLNCLSNFQIKTLKKL